MKGYKEHNDDDELVTNYEQLNHALARSDAEFETFQKMDEDEERVIFLLCCFFIWYLLCLGMDKKASWQKVP